jgi:hypothetical protein
MKYPRGLRLPQRWLCSLLDAAMRLRLSDPHLVPDLLQFLELRLEMVVERIGENEVELSLIGSYNREAERLTVDLLVRAWEAGRDAPGSVEFVD